MKKIFLLTIAAAISFGSIAQGNSNHGHKNKKEKKEKKSKDRDHHDGHDRDGDWRNRDDRDNDDRNGDQRNGDWRTSRNDDGRYDNRRNDDGRYDNRRNDQNAGRAPRRVTDAFYRDYPNASNVTWSQNRGVWSARFRRSGLFGGNTTASYRANGDRINNNNLVTNRPF